MFKKKNELNEDILLNCKLNIWAETKNELKKKAEHIVGREFQTEFSKETKRLPVAP